MPQNQVISYPTPLYNNNLPIQSNFYKPGIFFIQNITLGTTTLVTTTQNVNYVIGQQIRLVIPKGFGCNQLNEISAIVISVTNNNVTIQLDTSQNVDPFVAGNGPTQPQILAIGDVNTGAINTNGPLQTNPFIPGSFLNISPL